MTDYDPTVVPGGGASSEPGRPLSVEAPPPSPLPPSAFAPADLPAPTQPVQVPARPRGGLWRWIVALVVVAIVSTVSVGGYMILAAGASSSQLLPYVPSGSLAYMELRTDLPGNQRANVNSLLARFPGFGDPASLDQKVDEVMARLFESSSSGKVDYASDVKPWLGGQLGFAVVDADLAAAARGTTMSAANLHFILLLSTKDPAKAQAWLDQVPKGATTTQAYGGVTLTVGESSGVSYGYTVSGSVVVLGDLASVKASLDAKTGANLGSTDAFRAAQKAIPGDHLGFLFLPLKRYVDAVVAAGLPGVDASVLTPEVLAKVPEWMTATLRAESDALVVDAAMPAPAGTPATDARVSTLAPRLPADTLAAIEVRNVGAAITAGLGQLATLPGLGEQLQGMGNLEDVGPLLGGDVDTFFAWMGDSAIVVSGSGSDLSGGLVVEVKDEAAAKQRLGAVRTILALAAPSTNGALAVGDEAYGDGSIVTLSIDPTKLSGLYSSAGTLGGPGVDALSGTVGTIEIAYTNQRGLFIVGVGAAWVKHVLETQPGGSLADQATYKTAIERAGARNNGQAYLDVPGIVQLVVDSGQLTGDQRSRYESDIRPYLEPVGGFALSSTMAGEMMTARFVVTFH